MNYAFNEDKQRVEVIPKADCKAYIVEEWHSGTEGYIVYSNGFCEQWGFISSAIASNTTIAVTLKKPYNNTNFVITACERYDSGTSDSNNENYWVSAVSNSSFTIYNSAAGGMKKLYWRVTGYIS